MAEAFDAAPRRLEFAKSGWRILDERSAGRDASGDEIEALTRLGTAALWLRRVE